MSGVKTEATRLKIDRLAKCGSDEAMRYVNRMENFVAVSSSNCETNFQAMLSRCRDLFRIRLETSF